MTLANLNYEANLFGPQFDIAEGNVASAEEYADRILARWKLDQSSLPGDLENVPPIIHSQVVAKLHAISTKDLQRAIAQLQPAGLAAEFEREGTAGAVVAQEPPAEHGFLAMLRLWRQRMRGRRELETLNDRELQDIGVTRADVYMECRKPFWRE